MSAIRFNHGNHCIKHFLFKYYALISIVAFIIAVFLLGLEKVDGKAFLAIAGGILTFAYSVQKQHLEEMILFKDLFEKFNKRYDRLNEKLNHIYPDQQPPEKPFTDDETDALSNYFNLCGEEYLYFARGFIHPEVWRSWENGMKHFRENPRIKKLWEDELNQSSYY